MKKNKALLFLFSVLISAALACNFPTVTPTPTLDVDATLTSFAFTQEVGSTPATAAIVFTSTSILTPTVTSTLPPSVPTVSVSVDTNCRTGPGVNYDLLTGLFVGETAEVVGKYTSVTPNYWVIKKGSATCWLWGQYATVQGNTGNLPEMTPPPSPTPTFTPTPTLTPTITQTGTATATPTVTNTPQ